MVRIPTFLLLAALGFPAFLTAQAPDLTTLSLEDFLKIEVISVRKGAQSLSRTAAAVHVITQEDIRRSGARSLPEALRLAPGTHVARINGSTWAVGIRGFNGFYSRKLLVMIDGRTIYNPIMSGVLWNQQMIMLEDVERIEVIRGPAGSMWGANAVNGVINIITRSAAETTGTLVSAAADTLDPLRVSARHGRRTSERFAWRAWFQESVNGQAALPSNWPRLNNWRASVGGARADWKPGASDEVMVQGGVQDNGADIHVVTYPQPNAPVLGKARSGGPGGFLLGRWKHTNGRGDESALQVYEDVQNNDLGVSRVGSRSFDLDFQHSIALPRRHSLLAGGGFRANRVTTQGTRDLWFNPANRTYLISNVFLQDEWEILPDRLVLTVGARLERYTLAGTSVQPTVRAIWTPNGRQSYWAAVSRAVRTPSHGDHSVRYPAGSPSLSLPFYLLLQGTEDLKPETMRAIDAGARWQAGRKAAVEVAGFYYFYADGHGYRAPVPLNAQGLMSLIGGGGLVPGAPGSSPSIPLFASNDYDGRNRGGEIALYYDAHPSLRLSGSYSALFDWQRLHPGNDPAQHLFIPYYSPRHQGQVRASWDFARFWTLDGAVSPVSGLRAAIGTAAPGFARVDLRVARKFGEAGEIYFSGQNLLYSRRREFIGDSLYPSGEIDRSIRIGFSRRF